MGRSSKTSRRAAAEAAATDATEESKSKTTTEKEEVDDKEGDEKEEKDDIDKGGDDETKDDDEDDFDDDNEKGAADDGAAAAAIALLTTKEEEQRSEVVDRLRERGAGKSMSEGSIAAGMKLSPEVVGLCCRRLRDEGVIMNHGGDDRWMLVHKKKTSAVDSSADGMGGSAEGDDGMKEDEIPPQATATDTSAKGTTIKTTTASATAATTTTAMDCEIEAADNEWGNKTAGKKKRKRLNATSSASTADSESDDDADGKKSVGNKKTYQKNKKKKEQQKQKQTTKSKKSTSSVVATKKTKTKRFSKEQEQHEQRQRQQQQMSRGVWKVPISRLQTMASNLMGTREGKLTIRNCGGQKRVICEIMFKVLHPDPDDKKLIMPLAQDLPKISSLLLEEITFGRCDWIPSGDIMCWRLLQTLRFFMDSKGGATGLLSKPWWVACYVTALNTHAPLLRILAERSAEKLDIWPMSKKKMRTIMDSKDSPPGAWLLSHVMAAIVHTAPTTFSLDIHFSLVQFLRVLKEYLNDRYGPNNYSSLLLHFAAECSRARSKLALTSFESEDCADLFEPREDPEADVKKSGKTNTARNDAEDEDEDEEDEDKENKDEEDDESDDDEDDDDDLLLMKPFQSREKAQDEA